jgi:hypothetical protein
MMMTIISLIVAELSTLDDITNDVGVIDDFEQIEVIEEPLSEISGDDINDIEVDDPLEDSSPAPFMLLFSSALLFFGISGILSYYLLPEIIRFIMFFISSAVAYSTTKVLSIVWKKIAKSRYYSISTSQNLIGKEGEVVLNVDERGGVIKVPSLTPLKFERVHVKALNPNAIFEKGSKVFVVDIDNGYFIVDSKMQSTHRSRYRLGIDSSNEI